MFYKTIQNKNLNFGIFGSTLYNLYLDKAWPTFDIQAL